MIALFLVLSAALLFIGLNRYALWDDESYTALAALAVCETGDTGAIIGDNIVAFRDGLLVKAGADRSTPPLPAYAVAASFKVFGPTAWAARLPFALAGFFTVCLLAFWSSRAPTNVQVVFLFGILCSVSLWLFCRQSRYYAFVIFFSTLIVFLYDRWRQSRTRPLLALISLSGALLFCSQYLAAVAIASCLLIDFLVMQDKRKSLDLKDGAAVLLPALLICLPLSLIWNPFATDYGSYMEKSGLEERLTLLAWNLRDLSQAEFLALPVFLAGVLLVVLRRDLLVARLLVFSAVYVVTVALVSPQPVRDTSVADIRYLVALLPAGVALTTAVIFSISPKNKLLTAFLTLLLFGTNLIHGGPWFAAGLRSTPLEFVGELLYPPRDPYSETVTYLKKNVPEGSSIVVFPQHMMYPLMFHFPNAVYGWQLSDNGRRKFPPLPPIHDFGKEMPDYFIAFGPAAQTLVPGLRQSAKAGTPYEHAATLRIFWKDFFRPELFWRTFREVPLSNAEIEGVHIFRRTSKALPAGPEPDQR